MKQNILNKIVKKDYNKKLEDVLSKKDFSEEVKNMILTMFYQIENGYKDYHIAKRETFEKSEYIDKLINAIEKDCEKIIFIKKDEELEEVVDRENKEIICLPIEQKILYSLAKIQKRNVVVKYIDKTIEEAFSFVLNTGNNINIVEPLRDFNGFSWNIITKDIEDLSCNLIYQNIIFLMGNKFMDKWVNNYEPLVDYFDLLQSEIEKKYGKKTKKSVLTQIIVLSIKLKSNYDKDFKNSVEQITVDLRQQSEELENREVYLINISKNKKVKELQIKQIDKIINDKDLIIEEYERRNKKLPLEKKIFSIRILKQILQEERMQLIEDINEYNKLMKPKYFLQKRNLTEKKLEYFEEANESEERECLLNLQKEVIKCMYIDIKEAEEKSTLINIIYKYRYYNYLPIFEGQAIYQVDELSRGLNILSKMLINKATEMKVINKISNNDSINYNIIQKLIMSKIIKLEDINIKLSRDNDGMYLTIFDEEIEDSKIDLNDISQNELKIKMNKKVKLFI